MLLDALREWKDDYDEDDFSKQFSWQYGMNEKNPYSFPYIMKGYFKDIMAVPVVSFDSFKDDTLVLYTRNEYLKSYHLELYFKRMGYEDIKVELTENQPLISTMKDKHTKVYTVRF